MNAHTYTHINKHTCRYRLALPFKVTQSLPYKLISYDRLAQKKCLLEKAIYLFSHILISMDVFSSNFGKIVPLDFKMGRTVD